MLKSGDKMKYKVGFVSLGCPKNLTDTETMAGILKSGCEIVTNPQKADIIIVNTCGFIESAKQESIDTILEMAQYKTGGNLKKLIVTGCLAQRYAKELRQEDVYKRQVLRRQLAGTVRFCPPEYAADNAVGTAYLCKRMCERGESKNLYHHTD